MTDYYRDIKSYVIPIVEEIQQETNKKIKIVKGFFSNKEFTYNTLLNHDSPDMLLILCSEVGLNMGDYKLISPDYFRDLFNIKNVIFIFGGIYSKENIPASYDNILCPTPYLYWFRLPSTINKPVDYTGFTKRQFMFDALLGTKRLDRIKLFKFLRRMKLLDKCLISIRDTSFCNYSYIISDYDTPELSSLEREEVRLFKKSNWIPTNDNISSMLIEFKNEDNKTIVSPMSCVISPKVYQNSWFSIVTETHISLSLPHFITEKTGKCLFAKRIFVCFSLPFHLKRLKEFGFKTFDGIIDESYDLEIDSNKRFMMLCRLISWLSKQNPIELYKKAEPILEHNFKIMTETGINTTNIKEFILNHSTN